MSDTTSLERAIAAIDAVNSRDPRRDIHDPEQPYELAYSRRMSECLVHFDPEASDALRIAAHAQHIARWKIPRSKHPMDRAGYKRWRTELGELHADAAAKIVHEAGYDEAVGERVRSLLKKRALKTDPECQTLEDVICLVFLEFYLEDFAQGRDEQELIRILQRTWAKMSERGRAVALKLPLSPAVGELVGKALAE